VVVARFHAQGTNGGHGAGDGALPRRLRWADANRLSHQSPVAATTVAAGPSGTPQKGHKEGGSSEKAAAAPSDDKSSPTTTASNATTAATISTTNSSSFSFPRQAFLQYCAKTPFLYNKGTGDGTRKSPSWPYLGETCLNRRQDLAMRFFEREKCTVVLEIGAYLTSVAQFYRGPSSEQEAGNNNSDESADTTAAGSQTLEAHHPVFLNIDGAAPKCQLRRLAPTLHEPGAVPDVADVVSSAKSNSSQDAAVPSNKGEKKKTVLEVAEVPALIGETWDKAAWLKNFVYSHLLSSSSTTTGSTEKSRGESLANSPRLCLAWMGFAGTPFPSSSMPNFSKSEDVDPFGVLDKSNSKAVRELFSLAHAVVVEAPKVHCAANVAERVGHAACGPEFLLRYFGKEVLPKTEMAGILKSQTAAERKIVAQIKRWETQKAATKKADEEKKKENDKKEQKKQEQQTEENQKKEQELAEKTKKEQEKKKKKQEAAEKAKKEQEAAAKEKKEQEAAEKAKKEQEAAQTAKKEQAAAEKAKKEKEAAENAKKEQAAAEKAKKEKEAAENAKKEQAVAEKSKKEQEAAAESKKNEEAAAGSGGNQENKWVISSFRSSSSRVDLLKQQEQEPVTTSTASTPGFKHKWRLSDKCALGSACLLDTCEGDTQNAPHSGAPQVERHVFIFKPAKERRAKLLDLWKKTAGAKKAGGGGSSGFGSPEGSQSSGTQEKEKTVPPEGNEAKNADEVAESSEPGSGGTDSSAADIVEKPEKKSLQKRIKMPPACHQAVQVEKPKQNCTQVKADFIKKHGLPGVQKKGNLGYGDFALLAEDLWECHGINYYVHDRLSLE